VTFPVVAVVVAVLCVACAPRADEQTVWRFAIEEVQGSVQDAYAQRFKALVEERTAGRVRVAVFPYGTLGTSDHLTELAHMGALQFITASPGHIGKLVPEVQAFLLHYVFSPDDEVNRRVLRDPALRAHLDALYRAKGLRFLAVLPEGWQVWTTNRAVRRPADFAGLKLRVMTSPLLLAAYAAYGASPTPLPYGEVYGALQLGMIDGQVNPIFAVQEMSFYEVTDHLTMPRQAPFVTTVVSNPAFFDGLSPEHRTLVDDVVDDLNAYVFDVQRRFNAERLALIREARPDLQVSELSEAESAEFRARSQSVRRDFVAMVGPSGQALLDLLDRTVASAAADVAREARS
jgi:tripartite ATP-independent transporter DctP family solute receptor